MKLQGTLPQELQNLTALNNFEVQGNNFTGPFPSFAGVTSLTQIIADTNGFTSFPPDFFNGMTSLQSIAIDGNPFSSWTIPISIKEATSLQSFSAANTNLNGNIPDFLGSLVSLTELHLGFNNLIGQLPSTFSGSSIQTLWLNGQKSDTKLNGSISVLAKMTSLYSVWLHGNEFTGPIPDFSNLTQLSDVSFRDNILTGVVPASFVSLPSLKTVNLTNNLLQGPTPKFGGNVDLDMRQGTNRFCTDVPGGTCDDHVNAFLSVLEGFGYPKAFADNWQGNDPCDSWKGIVCLSDNVSVVNFRSMGLSGTISPNFLLLPSITKLILSDNFITGTIPIELTKLPNLVELDVSNNRLFGNVPSFRNGVKVSIDGNPDIGKGKKKSKTGIIVGAVFGVVGGLLLVGAAVFYLLSKKKKRSGKVQSPHAVEAGNMVISIQVLKNVTNNFSEKNILGRGGFGIVYKGELHDGTKIAVKRMQIGPVVEKGLNEFMSEIAVLTKVRHRHLVALLGHYLDGNERLLVYEYMPQGTLSQHLFNWRELGLKPLEWTRRLTIALDVARGVEYLHGLAHQSFIHRDLKPSNILLGDDMRAKVADFGLVRLAPVGRFSVETKVAGTFGYLAPEYAVTGRVTTKVDLYSFGVILMELITGRKAVDESLSEDCLHLVTWFRRMHLNKDTFRKAIDPTIDFDEETLASISTVAELAGYCTARKCYKRPHMGHAVNVLSSLVELWKPAEPEGEDIYGIDLDMPLLQALKKWQTFEGMKERERKRDPLNIYQAQSW